MTTLIIGARVRVALKDTTDWSEGAVRSLDGKVGTVEAIAAGGVPHSYNVLVRFDEPARSWWASQTPPTGWHFRHEDLDLFTAEAP
jgi:hypothetical protein